MTDPALLDQKPPLLASIEAARRPSASSPRARSSTPTAPCAYELQDVRGYDPLALDRYVALLSQLPGYCPVHYHRYFTSADAPLLDLFNVKYLLTDRSPANPRWQFVAQDGDVQLYRNRQFLAACLLCPGRVRGRFGGGSTRRASSTRPSTSAAKSCWSKLPTNWTSPGRMSPVMDLPPTVQVVSYTRTASCCKWSHQEAGLVVLTDAYQRGWRAWVNRRQTPDPCRRRRVSCHCGRPRQPRHHDGLSPHEFYRRRGPERAHIGRAAAPGRGATSAPGITGRRRMKILHVIQGYSPSMGGSQWLTQQLAEHLVHRYGDQATVFTTVADNLDLFHRRDVPALARGDHDDPRRDGAPLPRVQPAALCPPCAGKPDLSAAATL